MVERGPISHVVVALGPEPADISMLVDQFPDVTFESVGGNDLSERAAVADAVAIGWISSSLSPETNPNLKWVQTAGAGVERIIASGLVSGEIVLTNGSGIMAPNMAEYLIGLMVGFARSFPALAKAQDRRDWKGGLGFDSVFELGGQTVLFIGAGDIAQETVKRLAGWGMTTIGVRRSNRPDEILPGFDRMVSIAELDSVLPLADHVISSVPSTRETQHMYDAECFAKFKQGAYFYNLGRGTSVVQADLIAALTSGQLAGAGLDVADPEPLPADDPLWDAPNLVLTGHTSGMTPRFRERLLELFSDNLHRWNSGLELRNVVDIERGY